MLVDGRGFTLDGRFIATVFSALWGQDIEDKGSLDEGTTFAAVFLCVRIKDGFRVPWSVSSLATVACAGTVTTSYYAISQLTGSTDSTLALNADVSPAASTHGVY